MGVWQSITWDVARAGGFTAYILLTLSVAIGLALTLQWQSPGRWPRLLNSELHNFTTLLALIFTGIHVLAVWIDPFTSFGWNEVLIPFVSHYRPLWMAPGIVGLYLGLAIGLSTWLRPLIGYVWWRRLHVLTLVLYALVTVHGLATGSDTQTWWGVLIYVSSVALVGGLLLSRLLTPVNARSRSHPVIATLVGLLTLAGVIWTVSGPLQAGWNAVANNGNGSGSRIAQAQSPGQSTTQKQSGNQQPSSDPYASPFTATLQGTISQTGPAASGVITLRINATLSNGAQGTLVIVLQGQQTGDDGGLSISSTQVTLGQNATTALYQGTLTGLRTERRWRMTALLNKSGSSNQLALQIEMQIDNVGQVSGYVQGTPTQGQSAPASPAQLKIQSGRQV
jgi:xanthosine utilization system XapX-like protein